MHLRVIAGCLQGREITKRVQIHFPNHGHIVCLNGFKLGDQGVFGSKRRLSLEHECRGQADRRQKGRKGAVFVDQGLKVILTGHGQLLVIRVGQLQGFHQRKRVFGKKRCKRPGFSVVEHLPVILNILVLIHRASGYQKDQHQTGRPCPLKPFQHGPSLTTIALLTNLRI
jgi:hypothetical protein